MEGQNKFLELMQEIKAIAELQQNKLTKEEIRKYLGDESLSEENLQAVYHYLAENHITVEGYEFVPDKPAMQTKGSKEAPAKGSRREANMKLYRMEIAKFTGGLEGQQDMILSFLRGDTSVKSTIIEQYLQRVVELAGRYQKRSAAMDEIIAEGNVGLMMAMQIVERNGEEYIMPDGSLDAEKFFGTLDMEITHAMEVYIDEMTISKDWENTVLAKTNLLHEAAKYMAEEIGRMPTIEELSEYTKLSEDEIKRIMGLSEDVRDLAH